MARINIDDELHADSRFKRLVRRLGNEDQAVGLLYRFWRLAQDYWAEECALMPFAEFEAEDFKVLEDVGFAERRDSGYYAAGAEERFSWYLQKCRAAKASVRSRGSKKTQTSVATETQFRSNGSAPPFQPTSTVTSSVTVTATDSAQAVVGDLRVQIQEASKVWEECLKKHGADRAIFLWEQTELARAIQSRGFEAVSLAILGQRYEPESPEFKPSRHLSLKRLFDPQKFDRFVNLGAQARKKLQEREQEQAKLTEMQAIAKEPPPDPAQVRAYLDGLFGKMPEEDS